MRSCSHALLRERPYWLVGDISLRFGVRMGHGEQDGTGAAFA